MRTWFIVLVMLSSILVLMISMPAEGSVVPDRFLPYADLLSKDQIFTGMSDRKFICTQAYDENRTKCTFQPDDDVFSEIYVVIRKDTPQYVSFELKKDALQVGDLILLWDMPDKTSENTLSTLFWDEHDGFTTSALAQAADHLDYRAPVSMVSFTFMPDTP